MSNITITVYTSYVHLEDESIAKEYVCTGCLQRRQFGSNVTTHTLSTLAVMVPRQDIQARYRYCGAQTVSFLKMLAAPLRVTGSGSLDLGR